MFIQYKPSKSEKKYNKLYKKMKYEKNMKEFYKEQAEVYKYGNQLKQKNINQAINKIRTLEKIITILTDNIKETKKDLQNDVSKNLIIKNIDNSLEKILLVISKYKENIFK